MPTALGEPFTGSLKPLIGGLVLCGFFMGIGVQTGPVSLVALIIYLVLFHYSVFYGLENVLDTDLNQVSHVPWKTDDSSPDWIECQNLL